MKSPYDVYTAPKNKRGPRSWAGTSVPQQTIYENLGNKEDDFSFISRDKEKISLSNRPQLHVISRRRNERQSSSDSSDSENELAAMDYERMRTIQKLERKYRKSIFLADKYKTRLESMVDAYNCKKLENESLQRRLDDAITENFVLRSQVSSANKCDSGAREAMCSVSELNADLEPITIAPEGSQQTLKLNSLHDDDEVKNFRSIVGDYDLSYHHQSFVNANAEFKKLHLEDDGYSTLHDSHSRQLMFKEKPQLPKRSLSDPAVSSKGAAMNETLTIPIQPKMEEVSQSVVIQSFPGHRKRNRSPTYKMEISPEIRRNNPSTENGYSSCSSEDSALKMFEKQLRRKGDVVHYRPPRTNLASVGSKPYRHFGTNERRALAHFEYLRDMSTDGSAMNSSRDQSPHFSSRD